ncbi:MAG: reverse transcriptase-like protein [Chloroflexota bacterium]
MYVLQFDGLYREVEEHSGGGIHAGWMSYGWLIYRRGKSIARGLGVFARRKYAGSSIAEYLALIDGLEALSDLNAQDAHIEIRGDAKCVLDQMAGRANVTSLSTRSLYRQASKLAGAFAHIEWHWVPRRENHAADSLTRQAIRRLHGFPATYRSALDSLAHPARGRASSLLPILDLRVFHFGQAGLLTSA